MRAEPCGTTGYEKLTAYTPRRDQRIGQARRPAQRRRPSPARSGDRRAGCRTPARPSGARKWLGVRAQPVAQLGGALDQVERRQRGAPRSAARGCSRTGTAASAGAAARRSRARRGDVAAAGAAHRLAQRAGDDVHPADHAVQLVACRGRSPDEADGVRVVDHHQRVVALGQVADLGQRRRCSRPSRTRRRSRSAGSGRRPPPRSRASSSSMSRLRSAGAAPCRAGCRR